MTTTTDRPRRRNRLFTVDPTLLLPDGLADLPAPIANANAHARRAVETFEECERAAGLAREHAKAAPEHDHLALEAALAAGEEDPEPTAPAKKAAANEARQRAVAAENVARRAILDLYDAVEDNLEDYLASRERAHAEATDGLHAKLAELVEQVQQAETAGSLLRVARQFHNNPNSAALSESGRGAADRFARTLTRRRSAVSSGSRGAQHVPDSLDELLAALTTTLETGSRSQPNSSTPIGPAPQA